MHYLATRIRVNLNGGAKEFYILFEFRLRDHDFKLQDEVINGAKYWYFHNHAIWYADGGWRLGKAEDSGTENSVLFAPGMKDDLPGDLRGQWSYWNPDRNEWVKARDDIVKVRWYFYYY